MSGATPSQLVLALGKDGNAYLLNRNNLGGIAAPVAQANVEGINRGTSAITYHTSQGTYFGFHNDAGTIAAWRITATSSTPTATATATATSTSTATARQQLHLLQPLVRHLRQQLRRHRRPRRHPARRLRVRAHKMQPISLLIASPRTGTA